MDVNIKRHLNFDKMSPDEILEIIQVCGYQMPLHDYYKKNWDFYNYFKSKLENKEPIELGKYEPLFFNWFRGVMAESDANIVKLLKADSINTIKGSTIEIVLGQNEFICNTYFDIAYWAYIDAFNILRLCKQLPDYQLFYNAWYQRIIDALESGVIDFNRFFEAIQPSPSDYIDGRLFQYYVSVNSFLTNVGEAFIDEINDYLAKELDNEYRQTSINFIYQYSKIATNEFEYPVDSFATLWPSTIPDSESMHGRIKKSLLWNRKEKEIKTVVRNAENAIRESEELPQIGETWISETVLFKQIEIIFYDTPVLQHSSPSFLGRQHYDVYLPDYKIALEYQGIQHFTPVSIFGGEKGYKKNIERDRYKKQLSKKNGVCLIEVLPDYDIKSLIAEIAIKINNLKYIDIYEKFKSKIDHSILAEEQRVKVLNIKNTKTTHKKKTISDKDRENAIKKLAIIKSKYNEGTWVELWEYGFKFSNADLLDLQKDDLINIAATIKQDYFRLKDAGAYSVGNDYADCIKRGANYFIKHKMYNEAIDILQFAIDHDLHLENVKDFDVRLKEVTRKKDN